jgi:hypothetical protein
MSAKVAKEKVWSNYDGTKLLPDGHPDQAHLIAAKGHRVPDSTLAKFPNVSEFFADVRPGEPEDTTVRISPALGRVDSPPVPDKDKSSVKVVKNADPAAKPPKAHPTMSAPETDPTKETAPATPAKTVTPAKPAKATKAAKAPKAKK